MEFKKHSWLINRISKEICEVNKELDVLNAKLRASGPASRDNLAYKVKVKEKVLAKLREELAQYENQV